VTYQSVIVQSHGGPEVMRVIENELRGPASGKVRIKVLATGVGRTDINYRYGYSPLSPKIPFIPGYEIVGVVDALGSGVSGFSVGKRVAALTGYGGYTEMITLGQEHLVAVPEDLDAADVAVLTLNYVSAYQMLHRVAKVKTGDKVLITGSSGGVGSAFLQLGKLAGLKMYGTASASKHALLAENGVIPIDYHTQDFVEVIRRAEPDGIDFVFDGLGGETSDRAVAVLRRGGALVGYAAPSGFGELLLGLMKLAWANLLPNGRSAKFYGISTLYMQNKTPFQEDLRVLFKLLQEGKIKPVITYRFPLLEAAKANALLEGGTVVGNVVLLA
jgi:NADPH:quinone reductase-like Zn-dependent oxidoreductase